MAKILCVLYPDPVTGYPAGLRAGRHPGIDHYPGGQTVAHPVGDRLHPGRAAGLRVR